MHRLVLLALTAAALAACSDVVDPTLGTAQAFSLYGYLDPTADRQAIRVAPILSTIDADTARALAATVTSTERGTGREATWRDSVVTYPDGTVGHVFVADYTPTPGVTVDVRVVEDGAEGRVTSVAVDVPPLARSEIGGPYEDEGLTTYPVSVPGVPRVIGGTLRLTVTGLPLAETDTSVLTVPTPATALRIRQEGGTWQTDLPFLQVTRDFLTQAGLFRAGVTLVEAEFAPFVANDAWAIPPDGLDEDRIVEPGTFTNVTGGFGFVGAGYEAPVRWVPSPTAQFRAGFSIGSEPATLITVNEVGPGFAELYNGTLDSVDLGGYVVSTGTVEDGVRIEGAQELAPGGFLVVRGPFEPTAGSVVSLLSPSGALISKTDIEITADAWGAFPDGYSTPYPSDSVPLDYLPAGYRSTFVDLFQGPVLPTPGAPNALGFIPAVLNEISTSGDGFVEVVPTSGLLGFTRVGSDVRTLAFGSAAEGDGRFLVAPERAMLDLPQGGGDVFLLAGWRGVDIPPGFRVVDVRSYGPQFPDRSVGYLPDGPDGDWTEGLLPTRGAANAAARLGL